MRDLVTRDITVDDVPFRIVFSYSKLCTIQANMVGVYHDNVKVLTLYKPTAEQMVARIRRAIDMCGFHPISGRTPRDNGVVEVYSDGKQAYYVCNRCGASAPHTGCVECE